MSYSQQNIAVSNKIHCDYGPFGNQETSTVTDFKIQEGLLKYLDQNEYLLEIEENAVMYTHVIQQAQRNAEIVPPFRFSVEIDIMKLTQISELLSDALVNDPLGTRESLREVVLQSVRSLGNLPDIRHNQVEVLLKVRTLTKLRAVTDKDHGLELLQGVLISRTSVKKYVCTAYFRCPCDDCEGSLGFRMPGHMLDKKPECSHCGLKMLEETRARVMGDHVVGMVIDTKALQFETYKRFQATCVSFQDEMTTDLELGVLYDIAGFRSSNTFHPWSVQRWTHASRMKKGLGVVFPPTVEKLLGHLRDTHPDSPWVFVATIASQLAHHLIPTSAFLNLKLGLLLSLASLGGDDPVPVLALGADTLSAHLLFQQAASLAPRCVKTPLELPVGGSEKGEEGNHWSEAGALLLAATGVCYLGDWAKFRLASQRGPILAAVESKKVMLGGPSLNLGPTRTSPTFPLASAVWTYWTRDQRTDSSQVNQTQLRTLIHVFGVPFIADTGREDTEVVRHILQMAIVGGHQSSPAIAIPQRELKEFIAIATAQRVVLGSRAKQLIQDYFVASRRVRPDCLPVGAIATITALSEAHARLSLRGHVGCADVLAVLSLYEETIANMFGHSFLTAPPARVIQKPEQVDKYMGQFAKWLESYIKSILGDTFRHINGEE